jgi:hypothetical protein
VLRVLLAGLVLLGTAACGYSDVIDKRDTADAIANAYEVARQAGVSSGEISPTVTVLKLRRPMQGFKEGMTTPEQRFPMVVDVSRARWALMVNVGDGPRPFQVYDDHVMYQYSPDRGRSRPWVGYDVADAYDERDELRGDGFGNAILNHAHLYLLLPGVLTGSIKDRGTEEVAGVRTRHYSANFDVNKALEDAPRVRREAVLTAFELMKAKTESVSGDVWLDDDGLPRKVTMRIKQHFTRREVISVNLTAIIHKTGLDQQVPVPADDEATLTDDLGLVARGGLSAVGELAGSLGLAGGGGAGGGTP